MQQHPVKCRKASTPPTCMNDYADSGFLSAKGLSSDAECLSRLPIEVIESVLRFCDAETLAAIAQTCSLFRAFDAGSGLRLTEKTSQAAVREVAGEQADRWRRRSWLSRLYIEDSGVGFAGFVWSSAAPSPQPQPGGAPYYRYMPPTSEDSFLHIKLEGMGPKLLVSDVSTADQPVLRWRLAVRGNTAVEFGVVPLCLEEDDKALHKCQQDRTKFERLKGDNALLDEQRPTGFCSSITVGSLLPFKTAIMKGSIVELLARRGRLEILVQNPPDGQELYWHNTRTVPKPYKGPREVRFEQDFSPDHDIKLALTSWAHGAFDVLHPAPGSRVLGPEYYQSWDKLTRRHSSSDSSTDPATPQGGVQQQPPPEAAAAAAAAEQQQPEQAQPLADAPAGAAAAEAAAAAAADAAAAEAAAAAPQQPPVPGSPSSDQSANSQDSAVM